MVETPFIIAAVIGVFLNAVLPRERSAMDGVGSGAGEGGRVVIGRGTK